MARIQILHLPCAPDANDFGVIIDEIEAHEMDRLESGSGIARVFGAKGVLISQIRLDVV